MTAQWVPIARTTVGSTTTAVSFTSIGSYESYRIVGYTADTAGSDYFSLYPNNTGSNLISRGFFANTSSGNISSNTHSYLNLGLNANNSDSSMSCNIADIYFAQSTTIVKPYSSIGGFAGNMVRVSAGAWNVTGTAISSIYVKVGVGSQSFVQNTVIALYGRNV